MGKIVVESNYRRFDPVGQDSMCASCSSGCKTSCVRSAVSKHETNIEKDFEGFKTAFSKEKET